MAARERQEEIKQDKANHLIFLISLHGRLVNESSPLVFSDG